MSPRFTYISLSFICFICVCLFVASPCKAEKPIKIKEAIGAYYLWGDRIGILEDQNQEWTIEQITSAGFAHKFVTCQEEEPYNRNRKAAYWIRFTVKPEMSIRHVHYLLQVYSHNANLISLYSPAGNGAYTESRLGDTFPFFRRSYGYRGFIFDLFPSDSVQTYYLRFYSRNHINLTSAILHPSALSLIYFREYWIDGLLYGLILAIALYNLFVFYFTREKQYLYYSLYLGSVTLYLMVLDGYAFQYLWPGWPAFNQYSTYITSTLVGVLTLLFARCFLSLKQHAPLFDHLVRGVIGLRVAMLIIQLLFFPNKSYPLFLDIIPFLFAFAGGIVTYLNGYREARLYIMAFSLLLLGYLFQTGKLFHWFDLEPWAFSGFRYGLIGESLLLTLAISDRLRVLKQEKHLALLAKEDAQEAVIRQLRENERLKEQANQQLEAKVAERTKQLLQAQKEIEQMNLLLQADNKMLSCKVEDISKARVMQKKITFTEFQQIYPDEGACLKFLSELKWDQGYTCIKCGHHGYISGKTPFSRRCQACRYDESVTVNTIFNRLRFPILKAFYMVFLIRTGKEMTIDSLSETLDLRRQTCWDFKIKILEALKSKKPSRNLDEDWHYLVNPRKGETIY